MQASPIQLIHLVFDEVSVSTRRDFVPTADQFDFEGIDIEERIGFFKLPKEVEHQPYGVRLGIAIEGTEQNPTPYNISVTIIGLFHHLNTDMDAKEQDKQAITVGLALLYSAIRDQVLSITSRGPHGPLTLPTVTFIDKKDLEPDIADPS